MSALELRDLSVRFARAHDVASAVDHVYLTLRGGEVVGLVGESGSGKSTLARAIVGLVPIATGEVLLDGRPVKALRSEDRCRAIQLVFQDPSAALNPRRTIGDSIAEGLDVHERSTRRRRVGWGRDQRSRVFELLEAVGLNPNLSDSRPSELSGGQRQRVTIARALAARPSVLVADEITSALDVSVQGAILNLLRDLQRDRGFSLLFISHNLAVVRYVADRIAVMQRGRLVEVAETMELVEMPKHPYTRILLAAVPRLGSDQKC